MSSTYFGGIKISIFGESHGNSIGVVIDNLPYGEEIDISLLQEFIDRRSPSYNYEGSTKRKERDKIEILSGLYNGKTNGAPFAAIIKNTDALHNDYEDIKHLARPGHSDYSAYVKYHGFSDFRGGGHFSGRLTAPLVIAGGVCAQILNRRDIYTFSHINSIFDVYDTPFNCIDPDISFLKDWLIKTKFLTLDKNKGCKMKEVIRLTSLELNSVGGTVETMIVGLPRGVGEPFFDGLESEISSIVFSIPAVKGIEFGAGFSCCGLTGSLNNDPFYYKDDKVYTRTNNHGGILGGISTGMPILFNTAFKPTPSIAKEQKTISMGKFKDSSIIVRGRHDACIVPRAVFVVISAGYIASLSALIKSNLFEYREDYESI